MFRKFSVAVILATAAITLMSCTVNKPAEQVRTITVSGNGTVYIKATAAITANTEIWYHAVIIC